MSEVPFHYVDLRAFCYETEDERRVADALRAFLPDADADADPEEGGKAIELERSTTEGHHGDRILVLSARLERADEIRHVLSTLRESADMDRIRAELDERVDEDCSLFVHLDKQTAYRSGEAALGDGIALRAKVEAYPAKRESAIENARDAL
jgi:RNA binding exosome subunit